MAQWTPERKARQSQAIREWEPWRKSTGPKTAAGKRRSSQNAIKHGRYRGDLTAAITNAVLALRELKQLGAEHRPR